MIKLTSISILITSLILSISADAAVSLNCKPSVASDPVIYSSDFKWGYGLKEMMSRFEEMYASPKRLYRRAYFDAQSNSYVMEVDADGTSKKVRLADNFLKSIRKHVEVSLARHYADAVFFPDMGHSHFFVPVPVMAELNKIDYPKDKNIFYERLFAEPSVKVLYHTAEQLKVKEGDFMKGPLSSDPYLQWRYFSRNVIGQNDGTDNVAVVYAIGENYNTVRELEGYENFSAGFNISANKNGCFEFTAGGKTYFYDLSMEDLPSDPNSGSVIDAQP